MLKNALGKAHSKNKKGKACLRTIEQEDISRVGAAIDQIADDVLNGVYQELIYNWRKSPGICIGLKLIAYEQ